MRLRITALLAAAIFCAAPQFTAYGQDEAPQEETEETLRKIANLEEKKPETAKITDKTELSLIATTYPDLAVSAKETIIIPFLRGKGELTKDNNISPSFEAILSPVSITGRGQVEWTPAAFFILNAGFETGSGWHFGLFGLDAEGIGIRRADKNGNTVVDGGAFDGAIYKFLFGATLQGDLAAFLPGDWNHIVFLAYDEVNYSGYSRAGKNDMWFMLNDTGENRNGWNYYGSFVLGYQMPIFLDMAAFMAELYKHITIIEGGEAWGDELPAWVLGALVDFKLPLDINITVLCQFRTWRNYIEAGGGREDKDTHDYKMRELDKNNSGDFHFYRAGIIFNIKVR